MSETVGPFTVLEELARGGMGAVYRARDERRPGQDVALKVLLAGKTASAGQRSRFKREANALRRMEHRGIVTVLDAGEHDGIPYLVMDLVPGPTLQQRLSSQGPLPESEAAELALQLAEAVAHAHSHGVLHRDLKPSNVLLDEGRPLLTDFGLAKFVAADHTALTVQGGLLGSPGYWAPEQARGATGRVGPAADVFGLGAVLYAALTGKPPVEGEDMGAMIRQVLEGAIPPPSTHCPELSPALESIVLRCLALEPEDRYPSAATLAEALRRFLAGLPPEEPAQRGASAPVRKQARSGRGLASRGSSGRLARTQSGPAAPLAPLTRRLRFAAVAVACAWALATARMGWSAAGVARLREDVASARAASADQYERLVKLRRRRLALGAELSARRAALQALQVELNRPQSTSPAELKRMLSAQPDPETLDRLKRAWTAVEVGERDLSLWLLSGIPESQARLPRVTLERGRILERLGGDPAAVTEYTRCLRELGDEHPRVYWELLHQALSVYQRHWQKAAALRLVQDLPLADADPGEEQVRVVKQVLNILRVSLPDGARKLRLEHLHLDQSGARADEIEVSFEASDDDLRRFWQRAERLGLPYQEVEPGRFRQGGSEIVRGKGERVTYSFHKR